MWAMNNNHTNIVKLLLERGASTSVKSATGRTAMDFITPNTELSDYMAETGHIGSAGAGADFYDEGLAEERFEDQFAENELKRRMMMESAMNLEVDLSSLGLDGQGELQESEEEDDGQDFVWDRCLPDQIFVFSESDMDRILEVAITRMQPKRSQSQKPVPANVIFLSARYAHYYASPELLSSFLEASLLKIQDVIALHSDDMPFLAFWISNAVLLLYYVKKDVGLVEKTVDFQLHLAELINDIFTNFVNDSIRRMDKVLGQAMLEHETIPGLRDISFQSDWRIFRSKQKTSENLDSQIRPPSPRQRAKVSPRNVTSLLSSTLFVLDLYDIHPVIITQVMAQLFHWLGCTLFNRILQNKTYLARTRAMQIRLNVSALEDWAKNNNRSGGHYEQGALGPAGESILDMARKHLAPVIQLLQWLQCFSSIGSDLDSLQTTIEQLPLLTPKQLLQASSKYRAEVGEKGMTSEMKKYLQKLMSDRPAKHKLRVSAPPSPVPQEKPVDESSSAPTISNKNGLGVAGNDGLHEKPRVQTPPITFEPEDDPPQNTLVYLDAKLMLPFVLPTATEMVVSYGGGLGGTNRERQRRYRPTLPAEFVSKLDAVLEPNKPSKAHIWESRAEDEDGKSWARSH